ncbi:MAG: hypothetical protein MUC78_04565 [Bacteroidales bacterium]|jgi:hypothetical protein|nr:hypothetical protein [Bacteroidales bacterium]
MIGKRFNIDLYETSRLGRVLRITLGVVCLIATGWFISSIRGTEASTASSWIATIFLLAVSFWLIASGLGYTDRYIIISEQEITLKKNIITSQVIYNAANLKRVELMPLSVIFITETGRLVLKLGTYYPEHSASIMEAVEEFCSRNKIEVMLTETGIKTD